MKCVVILVGISTIHEFVRACILEEAHELNETISLEDEQDELADVLMYALTLATLRGYDVTDIIRKKAQEVMARSYD